VTNGDDLDTDSTVLGLSFVEILPSFLQWELNLEFSNISCFLKIHIPSMLGESLIYNEHTILRKTRTMIKTIESLGYKSEEHN